MPVVGTAGHVDHGKSTLIQSITGRNPDRWAEERERGLTIDLGFAWATLPGGTEVSFVDVPGHERFLKNMLAGIEAIDVALFVVAADEGWMPQSEEHLAVLDLLGVSRGVIALTKTDLVDSELIELARAETEDRLTGTSLESAPVIAVSGVSGHGVEELLTAVESQLPLVESIGSRPRMWVDRSFPVAGAGTIVTGTLLDGPLSVEDTVQAYPDGRTMRVRGIQSHERSHNTVEPAQRVALNVGRVSHDEIGRGDMVGLPGQWILTSRVAVSLRTARYVDEMEQKGAYQLHIGSAAHRVEITGLGSGVAILQTEAELPLTVGDRFILRDTGRQLVIAGGRVLDPEPGRARRALATAADVDPTASPDSVADALLTIRGEERLDRLAAQSRGGRPTGGTIVGESALTGSRWQELTARAEALVGAEHESHPLRPGLPLATLAERLEVAADVADEIVDRSEALARHGPSVALAGHSTTLTADEEEAWLRARERLGEGLAVPTEPELALDPEILALKLRSGELVRIAPDLVYLREQLDQLRAVLAGIEGSFTVADFRDKAGLTRKYAVPLLEWSDKEGLTVRRGDVRHVR